MPGHNKAKASRRTEAGSAWAQASSTKGMQTDETGLNWTEGKLGHQVNKFSRTGLLTPGHGGEDESLQVNGCTQKLA